MNTQLHDLMHRDVQELVPDLDALTAAARRRGLSIRRRRQALGTLGAVAAIAVVAVGATQLQGTADGREPAASLPTTLAPASGTVPATGEATTAGLRDLLDEMAGGRAAQFAGQDSTESQDSYGELRWFPADGSGFSDVGLNLQPGFADRPVTLADVRHTKIYRCESWQVACSVTRRDGATLMTYEEVRPTAAGNGIRVTADLLRADGVRVVASATNGADLPANKWRISRPRPALSAEQLTSIVSEPWWGPRLPAQLGQEGKQLTGYTDLDEKIDGQWAYRLPDSATSTP